MFTKKIFIFCFYNLILTSASLPSSRSLSEITSKMMINEINSYKDENIAELICYSNKINDTNRKNREFYDHCVASFLKDFAITFKQEGKTLTFECVIPKNYTFKKMMNECMSTKTAYNAMIGDEDNTFFGDQMDVLFTAESSAIDILKTYAETGFNQKRAYDLAKNAGYEGCNFLVFEQIDEKCIVAINWIITLLDTKYECSFLHNQAVSIRKNEHEYVVSVDFCNITEQIDADAIKFDFVAHLKDYYLSIKDYNSMKIYEKERVSNFYAWAKDTSRTRLAEFINSNSEFIQGLFTAIQKQRSLSTELNFVAKKGYLQTDYAETKDFYTLNENYERKIIKSMFLEVQNTGFLQMKINTNYLFRFSKVADNKNDGSIFYNDIKKLVLFINYIKLCFEAKKYRKIHKKLLVAFSFCKNTLTRNDLEQNELVTNPCKKSKGFNTQRLELLSSFEDHYKKIIEMLEKMIKIPENKILANYPAIKTFTLELVTELSNSVAILKDEIKKTFEKSCADVVLAEIDKIENDYLNAKSVTDKCEHDLGANITTYKNIYCHKLYDNEGILRKKCELKRSVDDLWRSIADLFVLLAYF